MSPKRTTCGPAPRRPTSTVDTRRPATSSSDSRAAPPSGSTNRRAKAPAHGFGSGARSANASGTGGPTAVGDCTFTVTFDVLQRFRSLQVEIDTGWLPDAVPGGIVTRYE